MAESERRGMGRGLSAILPPAAKGEEGLREIPVELVKPNPRQPRQYGGHQPSLPQYQAVTRGSLSGV